MNPSEEQIFIKENMIQSKEYLSPSGRYKIIIETYETKMGTWNYTKGTIYSCSSSAQHWVGEIKRKFPHFPFLFFHRPDGQEYLISGRTFTSQTIINCETGHIYDNTEDLNRDPLCWNKMWQLDKNTICVCGSYLGVSEPNIYSFFDFSNLNLGWKRLDVQRSDHQITLPNYHYFLTNNDSSDENNYPDPIIENGTITFIVKETRIFGIGINSHSIKEIDMEINSYKEQEDFEEGFKIPYSKSKTYQIDMARMRYRRVENHMELIEFWRDERQMELDGVGIPEYPRPQRCNDIYQMLDERLHTKYSIRYYPTSDERFKWNITLIPRHTRSYQYSIEFGEEENSEIIVKYFNWRYREQDKSLSIWDQNGIINLIV
jgi:hypothetical protein